MNAILAIAIAHAMSFSVTAATKQLESWKQELQAGKVPDDRMWK